MDAAARGTAGALAAGVALALALAPADGAAQMRRGGRVVRERPAPVSNEPWWGFDDFGQTLLQMQRESIASQEEQAREAGRQQRRDELGKEQEQRAAERAAYYDSLIEASRAALRAPRGVYYRKPGFIVSDPPPGAQTVTVEGIPYLYDRGIFLVAQGSQFLVVTAPVGAVVGALPDGAYPVLADGGVLYYFFGTFFRAREGAYAVVVPPPGTSVIYLPDGYTAETADGATRYRFGPTTFKPIFSQGVLVYRVTAP